MRELNLDQLRTLVTVADLGTLSAASRALNLAQPTVSLHVSELEARLGVPLLLRGARRVQPTPAGDVLLVHARRLLAEADDAVQAVRRQQQGVTGRVRLGASTGMLVYLLGRVLQDMERAHPEVHVEVSIYGTNDGQAALQAGTLDVALIAPPQAAGDLVVTRWRRDPLMAFLPLGWKAPRRVTPQWLAAQHLIANDSTTRLYRQTTEWFATAGIVARPRIVLNYNEAMKSLVAAGYGAAILPMEGPMEAHTARGVRVVPLKPLLVRDTVIVHRALPLLSGATRSLLAVLKQYRQG
ncbi:LysR family transcriptional regulator [Ramlibacter sp.]|uniref:LysR family transcriptional regulator n=1 Tax=Ramlibacter sp. TaxID=1917967 RepID=UPI0035AED63D